MRLRLKFLLLLLPLVIIPLVFLGSIAYLELKEATEKNMIARMYAEIRHVSEEIEEQSKMAKANIDLFARNTILQKYVLNEDPEHRYALLHGSLMRVFQSYQEAFPIYYEIRIIMTDGTEDIRRTTHFIDNENNEKLDKTFFEQSDKTEKDAIYTYYRHNPDNDKYSLYVAKPLWLSDHLYDPLAATPRLRGYLVLTVSLDEINAHIKDKTGFWLLDSDGKALHKPDYVNVDRGNFGDMLNQAAGNDGNPVSGMVNINGDEVLSVAASPEEGLYLLANYSLEELHSVTSKLAFSVLAIILAVIIFTTVIIYMLVNKLVIQRIRLLGGFTDRIAQGEIPNQTGIAQTDEIGLLARSIESMSASLQDSQKEVHHLAYHDSLTGLPNRRMFIEYLNRLIVQYERSEIECHMAVLFLDLDDFKMVNDIHGHEAGDAVLQYFSRKIKKVLRKDDLVSYDWNEGVDNVVARLGGDEFVMLLVGIKHNLDAHTVANRIVKATAVPIEVNGKHISTSTSIGISLYPEDASNCNGLLKGADMAMYHAKNSGKSNIQFYTEEMNEAINKRIVIQGSIQTALDNNQLEVYYQPQVDTSSKLITGLEALVRWNKPGEGVLLPGGFIPIAEESKLIFRIGEYVVSEVCRQIRQWKDSGFRVPPVSINVSAKEMQQRNRVRDHIVKSLDDYKLQASDVIIELTESTIFSHQSTSKETMAQLHKAGLRIHLDDFGTGYSSLSHLQKLPVSAIKIDRSFIQSLHKKDKYKIDKSIVSATIAMAHALDVEVIAEGVEKKYQLEILSSLKCDKIQGFLFYKPCQVSEIQKLLADNATLSDRWFNRTGGYIVMQDS